MGVTPLLELVGVSYAYPSDRRRTILQDVSGVFHEGETVGVVGPNGSGKSTLLKILATLLRPTAGRLLHHGRPLHRGLGRYRCGVNYSAGAPQGFYPRLTAAENLRFFAGMKGTDCSARHARSLLDSVGLAGDSDTVFAAFSLGMRQRLHLARLLLEPSSVWIIDEPTNGLDADGVRLLEALMSGAPDKAKIVVSHDADFLSRVATRRFALPSPTTGDGIGGTVPGADGGPVRT
ncbi:ABC transporter ATP-binding protein [Streptomyces sp. NPDC006984]|uniref:ABC transporter ATP-binding protein n=1 Tax=unclassified Streptomyces TaxID=2593676 RepID=UPI0033F5F959